MLPARARPIACVDRLVDRGCGRRASGRSRSRRSRRSPDRGGRRRSARRAAPARTPRPSAARCVSISNACGAKKQPGRERPGRGGTRWIRRASARMRSHGASRRSRARLRRSPGRRRSPAARDRRPAARASRRASISRTRVGDRRPAGTGRAAPSSAGRPSGTPRAERRPPPARRSAEESTSIAFWPPVSAISGTIGPSLRGERAVDARAVCGRAGEGDAGDARRLDQARADRRPAGQQDQHVLRARRPVQQLRPRGPRSAASAARAWRPPHCRPRAPPRSGR